MSHPFTLPGAPAELLAKINARRARIPAGMTMSGAPPEPQRPEGVSDDEWAALGDPGKRAIVRERAAREQAERDLVAARSAERLGQKPAEATVEPVDINAIIQQAVTAAIQPFQQAQQERETEEAQRAIREEVRKVAEPRLHDVSDALVHLSLSDLSDASGKPDAEKIKAAVDSLVTARPYLARPVDTRRQYDPANPLGGAPGAVDSDAKVKQALDRMKAATGVKLAEDA